MSPRKDIPNSEITNSGVDALDRNNELRLVLVEEYITGSTGSTDGKS